MTFSVRPLTYHDALYVAERMRISDQREIAAIRGGSLFAERIAMDCHLSLQSQGIGYVAYAGEVPVVVIGAIPCHPGLWSAYMFATGHLTKIGLGLTRWTIDTFIPEIVEAGAHRIQCDSIEGHDHAHAWLKTCGAKNEGAMLKFGIGQETFYRFAWTGD